MYLFSLHGHSPYPDLFYKTMLPLYVHLCCQNASITTQNLHHKFVKTQEGVSKHIILFVQKSDMWNIISIFVLACPILQCTGNIQFLNLVPRKIIFMWKIHYFMFDNKYLLGPLVYIVTIIFCHRKGEKIGLSSDQWTPPTHPADLGLSRKLIGYLCFSWKNDMPYKH